MAHIANWRGDVCDFKKPRSMPLKKYYSSSSSSSWDDSDSDSDSVVEIREVRRRSPPKGMPARVISRGPPPPPPDFCGDSKPFPNPRKVVVEEIIEVTRDIVGIPDWL